MLKIHQIFIIKFLLLFAGALLTSSIISYIVLKDIVIEYSKEHLESVINVIELNIDSQKDIDKYAGEVKSKNALRVTIINSDGEIIAESDADKSGMDNHGNRYEVMQANNNEFGYIIRYSNTLKVDHLYVAKKIITGDSHIYVRLAIPLDRVMSNFYELWSKLLLVFSVIILIAFLVSKSMSQRIIHDVEQLTIFLDNISNKNYTYPMQIRYFYEFLHISQLLKNLVKRLKNREKQKRKYTAKLRLMNKQRNDILSALSHEFKNPLASVLGYAQTLKEDLELSGPIRERFLGKIITNSEKMTKMLDRLALSVKLENNDLEIKPTQFHLEQLAQEIITTLAPKYKEQSILLEAEEVILNADKTMIELVLNNLIDNALKYSRVDVKIVIDSKYVRVIDRGVGIQEEHLEKVTSKFYRVKKNTWDNSMGLGLAMVSYVLKMHGSELEIESEYGKGSIFSFSIETMRKK